jgi:hypothetical protein
MDDGTGAEGVRTESGGRRISSSLKELRGDAADVWKRPNDRLAIQVLLASLVLIIVYSLWGRPGFFGREWLPHVAARIGWSAEHDFYTMAPYLYWAVTSVVIRIVLPLAIILLWLRRRPSEFGYRLRGVTSHSALYLVMFLVMIPIVVAASFTPAFQAKYPLYHDAILGWDHFAIYQVAYGIQFLGVEAFFRGFMTFGLYPRFGYLSLFIMVIPYSMVHFGKPPVEVFMAIPAGLILGYLALKSRTWLFGALLHWSVAITMDSLAILHAGGFRSGGL